MEASAAGPGNTAGGTELPPVDRTPPQPPYTWPRIAISNDKSSGVSDADAEKFTAAIAHQVLYDFGPLWHTGGHFVFSPSGSAPPAGHWVVQLLDSSDQAGALGYHDLTPDGLPLGKVFAGTDRQFGDSVSVTLSHEVLEMLGDPWIDLSAQADDGKFYAWEASDAVEADALGYSVGGVPVSAFVTPAWFGHGAGPLSCPAGRVSKPFELAPGGYISVFDPSSGRGWTQVQAREASIEGVGPAQGGQWPTVSRVPAPSPLELAKSVPRVGSRRERRFRGRARWVLSTYQLG